MKNSRRALGVSFCAAFCALTAVCAWISIPTTPPFTMQSFAVLLTAALLPMKHALSAYFAYIFLGAVGLPVFSSFTGGIGTFVGPTGGYLFGFFLTIIVTRLVISRFGRGKASMTAAFLLGTAALYIFAAVYYSAVYLGKLELSSVIGAFTLCVLPFVPFDMIKLILAVVLARRLERVVLIESEKI